MGLGFAAAPHCDIFVVMRNHIVAEIRRLTAENGGRPPGRTAFERETGIRTSEWYGKYWARWGDALVEAGFQANERMRAADPEVLLWKVAEAYRHYGRIATHGELKLYRQIDASFPWTQTLDNTFGSKPTMVAALRDWCVRHGDFEDVAALLPATDEGPRGRTQARRADGSVYLIRSGANYKIGRSDELERRIKEIRVALPDAAVLVHVIATDDPPGIEAYWHRRFSDRRANGEWFKLTSADVLAFKRRKFQ